MASVRVSAVSRSACRAPLRITASLFDPFRAAKVKRERLTSGSPFAWAMALRRARKDLPEEKKGPKEAPLKLCSAVIVMLETILPKLPVSRAGRRPRKSARCRLRWTPMASAIPSAGSTSMPTTVFSFVKRFMGGMTPAPPPPAARPGGNAFHDRSGRGRFCALDSGTACLELGRGGDDDHPFGGFHDVDPIVPFVAVEIQGHADRPPFRSQASPARRAPHGHPQAGR